MDAPTRQIGKALVVAPQGRVDQATADQLRLALEPHLVGCTADGAPVILDFSGVSYISSVGLRVLMLAARQAKAQKGRLAIAALQPVVREVFQISRFDMVFKVYDTVEAAVATVGA